MRLHALGFFFLLLTAPLFGDELLPTVQRELRAQKFYFGEIDGRASEETTKAIENFQKAKGLEMTGNLDFSTRRALGLATGAGGPDDEARKLAACCDTVLRYWQARQKGGWERVRDFYAPRVDYFYDGFVEHSLLERYHAQEERRWPYRRFTLINRIAASHESGWVQVMAQVRSEVAAESGASQNRTEYHIFRLESAEGGWRIILVKLLLE